MWRMTTPPCRPVAPVMSTVLSALSMILSPVSLDSVRIQARQCILLFVFAGSKSQNGCSSPWIQSTWLEGVAHREKSLSFSLTFVTGKDFLSLGKYVVNPRSLCMQSDVLTMGTFPCQSN